MPFSNTFCLTCQKDPLAIYQMMSCVATKFTISEQVELLVCTCTYAHSENQKGQTSNIPLTYQIMRPRGQCIIFLRTAERQNILPTQYIFHYQIKVMICVEFFRQHNKLHIPNFTVKIFAKKTQKKPKQNKTKQKTM